MATKRKLFCNKRGCRNRHIEHVHPDNQLYPYGLTMGAAERKYGLPDRYKNPPSLNKWLPVSAVKFNRNGSVSMRQVGCKSNPKQKKFTYVCTYCGNRVSSTVLSAQGKRCSKCNSYSWAKKNPTKRSYTFSNESYTSSKKRDAKKKIVSLPRGYVKGPDGVYRYSKRSR